VRAPRGTAARARASVRLPPPRTIGQLLKLLIWRNDQKMLSISLGHGIPDQTSRG
jgi:hypothetical protein